MPKNISLSFSGIITICNLFNRLNRNTASRVISLFKMPTAPTSPLIRMWIKTNRYLENYQFWEAFLFDDSAQKIKFLEIYKFGQHIACQNLSLHKIKHK